MLPSFGACTLVTAKIAAPEASTTLLTAKETVGTGTVTCGQSEPTNVLLLPCSQLAKTENVQQTSLTATCSQPGHAHVLLQTVHSAYYVRGDTMDTPDKTFTFLLPPPSAINTMLPPQRKGQTHNLRIYYNLVLLLSQSSAH